MKRETISLATQMLDIFVTPGEVFDEIIAGPVRPAIWVVPTLLVCLATLFLVAVSATPEQISAAVVRMVEAGRISATDTTVSSNWFGTSALLGSLSVVVGTLWSALIVWGVSRICFKADVPFSKALEVAGMAGMVLVLGTLVTGLLILASGNPSARPSLSLLASGLGQENPFRAALDAFNIFYLWSTAVLAIGLSRLSRVSLKEAAFWAFGYWLILRVTLILLG